MSMTKDLVVPSVSQGPSQYINSQFLNQSHPSSALILDLESTVFTTPSITSAEIPTQFATYDNEGLIRFDICPLRPLR